MLKLKGKLYWSFAFFIALFPTLIGSFPSWLEKGILIILNYLPSLKKWGATIDTENMMILNAFGVIIFILCTLARFQEYKIRIETIGLCRRQINLFRYFSYMSIGYVVNFTLSIYSNIYFNDPDVIRFVANIINAVFFTTSFFLLYCIVKVYVLEEILDHHRLDQVIGDLIVTIPGFSKIRIQRDDE